MFDARLRPLIDPPLDAIGRRLARIGMSADGMTMLGFAFGLAAALSIANGYFLAGLVLLAINRFADGLDGAVARATGRTDRGGYLDIVLDFFIYGAIPFAFAVADPARNALPAAALLLAFYANGSAFLAFAVYAQKRGLETRAQGAKSLYFLGGLAEGAETILAFALMCLLPEAFPLIALLFAVICGLSAAARVTLATRMLRSPD
ncbi:CDP-alcohol phosphatidyltransferase family protein [Amorphus orientalis]|uniref:Phosphatidylglycerophosphate synthase n=1 Tax=Amorphus orientalis TaxID=649198 RepID=A0AAE3VKY5_9HYPH|nr:CDP-alcohol phosphatidyltransferase family protein [Amorphus orientalis]MDQ0313925.1 phosphatidylglycerophosphate synthase [Amorphus orientalis]